MEFRDLLQLHLSQFPFDIGLLKDKNTTVYGMDLFVEAEFSQNFVNVGEKFLNVKKFYSHRDREPNPNDIDFVAIWGISGVDNNTMRLFEYAQSHQKPILIIEDGFLRSFYPMSYGELSASVRYDNSGCYYDCNNTNSIENLLNSDFCLDVQASNRIDVVIKDLIASNITKYAAGSVASVELFDKNRDVVLVIDQVYGDMSVQLGGIADSEFDMMVELAIAENPDAQIVVKLHPEAVLGIRKGHYDAELLRNRGINVISEHVNSISLLKQIDKVYCATTQMGLEAVLCGKEVHVFGKPFYAGWGLTVDRKNISRRNKKRDIQTIFYSAYIHNTTYINPLTLEKCSLYDIINYFRRYINDSEYLLNIRQKRLELRLLRLEHKIQEIEPLKETAVTLDWHIRVIKDNIFYVLGEKLERLKCRYIKKRT
jgi:capsule polysaccharide export protein KpsC/LpsZ